MENISIGVCGGVVGRGYINILPMQLWILQTGHMELINVICSFSKDSVFIFSLNELF